jgi:hypothetical protein
MQACGRDVARKENNFAAGRLFCSGSIPLIPFMTTSMINMSGLNTTTVFHFVTATGRGRSILCRLKFQKGVRRRNPLQKLAEIAMPFRDNRAHRRALYAEADPDFQQRDDDAGRAASDADLVVNCYAPGTKL